MKYSAFNKLFSQFVKRNYRPWSAIKSAFEREPRPQSNVVADDLAMHYLGLCSGHFVRKLCNKSKSVEMTINHMCRFSFEEIRKEALPSPLSEYKIVRLWARFCHGYWAAVRLGKTTVEHSEKSATIYLSDKYAKKKP